MMYVRESDHFHYLFSHARSTGRRGGKPLAANQSQCSSGRGAFRTNDDANAGETKEFEEEDFLARETP